MIENARRQVILVLLIALAATYFISSQPFKLGVDLRGGTELMYEVDIDEAKREGLIPANATAAELGEKIGEVITVLMDRIDPQGVTEASVTQRGDTGIMVELPDMVAEEAAAVERRIENLGRLEMRVLAEDSFREQGIAFNLAEEKPRLEAWLNNEGGKNRRLCQQDPTKIGLYNGDRENGPLSSMLRWFPGRVKPRLDNDTIWSTPDTRIKNFESSCVDAFTDEEFNGGIVPDNPPGTTNPDGSLQPFLLEYYPINMAEEYFTGKDLNPVGVRPTLDEVGRPALAYQIKEQRAGDYADWSEEYTGKRSAIILNDFVESAPTFEGRIPGRGQITGNFTQGEIDDLVKVLRTGSLDIRPILQSRTTIGPTLGQESIDRGIYSIAIGGALVLLFILAYYRTAGLVAFTSLVLNIFLILGVMQFVRATFTLPGIGGLVLTMGMAVDANILIYERIREELARGKDLLQGVRTGFDRAMVTILDANITTFLAGMVLYNIGVGPIRGFAVTLMVGILTSLFTAFFVSRLTFHFLLERKIITSFKAGTWLKDVKINFLRWSKPALIGSTVLIVLGIINMVGTPKDVVQGLDFTGGANLHVVLKDTVSAKEIRDRLAADVEFSKDYPRPRVNTLGTVDTQGKANEFSIRIKLTDALRARFDQEKRHAVEAGEQGYQAPYHRALERILADLLVPPAFSNERVVPNPGGTDATASITLNFARPIALETVRQRLSESLPGVVVRHRGAATGDTASVMIVDDWLVDRDQIPELLPEAVSKALGTISDTEGNPVRTSDPIPESEEIGGRMVEELRNAAIGALLIAMFLIVMFIRVRFHEYKYGFAAVAALLHDVLITLGVVVLANATGLVEAELNLAMIAAFLTIIGYSINDTIVIFDRVRENISEQARLGEATTGPEIFNRSINQTLSRTILTTCTTLFVVLTQFVVNFGQGSALEGFSFALVIGLLSGTYSTIFIASPLVNWMQKREKNDRSGSGKTKAVPETGAA